MKSTSINGSNTNDLNLVALADIKHASMMLTNWSTTVKNGCTNKRRVGLELVEFECVEAQTNYYYGRMADMQPMIKIIIKRFLVIRRSIST